MSPFRVALTVAPLLLSTSVLAEEPGWVAPSHLIEANPTALLVGGVSVEYEQAYARWASVIVGADAIVFDGPLGIDRSLHPRGGVLKLGTHFFPWGNALNGFWIGPEVEGAVLSVRREGGRVLGGGIAVDGALGYTCIIANHVNLSLGVGAGWAFAASPKSSAQGLDFTARLGVGYAF